MHRERYRHKRIIGAITPIGDNGSGEHGQPHFDDEFMNRWVTIGGNRETRLKWIEELKM